VFVDICLHGFVYFARKEKKKEIEANPRASPSINAA